MFETMSGFLWAFIPCIALICIGILNEEKMIAFEDRLFARLFHRK